MIFTHYYTTTTSQALPGYSSTECNIVYIVSMYHVGRFLNSNHHLVDFFPRFVGGRMVMPSVQRANGALILAAIKSTRLVANANRPEGIFAFPVSPYYHTTESHISPPRCYTNPVSPELCHAHHVHVVWLFCSPQVLVQLVYLFWVIN